MSNEVKTKRMLQLEKARAFLRKKDITASLVSPRTFATAALQLDMGFTDLYTLIKRLLDGSSGMGNAPITMSMLKQSRGT